MKTKPNIAGLLYPRRCALCDGLLDRGERFLCAACRRGIDPQLHLFEGGFAPFSYHGNMRAPVLRMKYAERQEYAAFFAAAILRVGQSLLKSWAVDAVVPVPIHWRRLGRRGFNQAELMARHLARALRVPLRADLLLRTKNTRPQKGLDHSEREENLREAFVCRLCPDPPARVLLVDDIYTSGATAREARAALRMAGIREVRAVCATVVL